MSKYTAEQVEEMSTAAAISLFPLASVMLRDYAALLRERESAKAAVMDEDLEALKTCCKEHLEVANHYLTGPYLNAEKTHKKHIGFHLALSHAIAALEAVAPMLASARVPDGMVLVPRADIERLLKLTTFNTSSLAATFSDWAEKVLAAARKHETEG